MLHLDGVVAHYGAVRALDDVGFATEPGRITAVLGANGAGKTTLLRAISGLVPLQRGTVRMDGTVISGRAPEDVVRHGVSHVPEGRGVIAELTVDENLRLGGLWRRDRRRVGERINEMYDVFPALRERTARLATTLSGGERQMLAIARALVCDPRVLLLDEPSLGLAPRVAAQIMAMLRVFVAEYGLTVVLVEQNARSALSIAHRGIVLNLGRVVADDDPSALAADERLRHAYLGF